MLDFGLGAGYSQILTSLSNERTRGAANKDVSLDVQMAFDRTEQAGLRVLEPAAVRKMREIVLERLTAMVPHGGKP